MFSMPGEPTIQELRELAAQVHTQSRHLYTFFEISRDAFIIFHRGYFAYVNPAWTEITGWSREETIGKHWSEMVCPSVAKNANAAEEHWKELGECGGQNALVCYRRKCGDEIMLSISWRTEGEYGYATARPVVDPRTTEGTDAG